MGPGFRKDRSRLVGLALVCAWIWTLWTVDPGSALAAAVKQSRSGICHDVDSPWYERTRRFAAYPDMARCLASGRPYHGYADQGDAESPEQASAPGTPGYGEAARGAGYDRRLYGSWADVDSDCLDTRHEVLRDLATGPVTMSPDGCRVIRGRWNDPYTGRIHRQARQLDIDHLVPLAWAHARGGDRWSARKRRRFANDPVNLFAVQASVNRSKGAAGPLEWLPPDPAYHCSYVTRFQRVVRLYGIEYEVDEGPAYDRLRERLCGRSARTEPADDRVAPAARARPGRADPRGTVDDVTRLGIRPGIRLWFRPETRPATRPDPPPATRPERSVRSRAAD